MESGSTNFTLERVYEFFQGQVQGAVNSLNSELNKAGGGSGGSGSGGTSGVSGSGGTSSTSAAGGGGSSSLTDPTETGKITFLFQNLSTMMTTEGSILKSIKDTITGMVSTIR